MNPDLVEQSANVMRIGALVRTLLEDVRNVPLDEAGRTRLAEIHRRSISDLGQGLAPELIDELKRITLPFIAGAASDEALGIARDQLSGWLEGLFHGIQTAIFARQMADQQQLQSIADVQAATARFQVASPVGTVVPARAPAGFPVCRTARSGPTAS